MLRRVIAGLVLVGLAIGVWLLWPEENQASPSATTVLAAEPTTPPPSSAPPTIAPEQSTSTTLADDQIVDSVEEAEAILRELWFGWFEGIYNQDEERIREVVATEEQVNRAIELFDTLDFESEPSLNGLLINEIEILRADLDCTALWADADATAFRGESASGSGVWILRRADDAWRIASLWASRNDLWEADCDALLS